MHHPTDRITHTTAFVTPVMEHWLEREIAAYQVICENNRYIYIYIYIYTAYFTIHIFLVLVGPNLRYSDTSVHTLLLLELVDVIHDWISMLYVLIRIVLISAKHDQV